jgi:hypothetical protein|tara:strand:- start:270 stop:419 length:150 start_codon:yes stop_codon:yes gene_type:complete
MRELKIKTQREYTFQQLREFSQRKYLLDLKLKQGIPILDGIDNDKDTDE